MITAFHHEGSLVSISGNAENSKLVAQSAASREHGGSIVAFPISVFGMEKDTSHDIVSCPVTQ